VARFLAFRDGDPVGRIAACVPREEAAPASFGFLCAERDAALVEALLGAARGFALAHGRSRMLGPLSFTINHEVGALSRCLTAARCCVMPARRTGCRG
jgi:hypothetical protein